MKTIGINDRDRRMLELLAKGASNRSVADSLGYREGTMRVYLHTLYRKLGVANKTGAVIWYFDLLRGEGREAGATPEPLGGAPADECFGDMALRTDPYTALGAMGMFLGAYGRMWAVARRLKGEPMDEEGERRRRQSRALWEALLKGDFAFGKCVHDDGRVARVLADAPSDGVLLGALLRIGGYTRAADRVMNALARKKKGRATVTAKENAFLAALRAAFDSHAADRLAGLYRIAADSSAKPVPRHAALVSLYWAYRARNEIDAARATANALWAEAENAREQLQAMGDRPLDARQGPPAPAAAKARRARASATTGTRAPVAA